MSVAEEMGKAIGRTVTTLSKEMGKQVTANAKNAASEMADYRDDAILKMNKEVAIKSLDPTLFKTKEFQDIAKDMKKRLKHSPGGVADWFQQTLGGIFEGFYDILIGIIVPSKIDDFGDAKQAAGYLTFLAVDVVVIVAVLDVIATACSLTLVRNLVHIGRLFISTWGLDRYIGAVIAPALQAGLIPRLQQGFNEQYQAQIPGSSDLIRMELREVFRPEFRPELLEPPTSGDFKSAMRKQGFNDYWSDSYWAAHWVLPSLSELDEMLHRGVINTLDWETMVRRNDYLPAWIPNRQKIIYNPYTRVDSRRMWDLAILSEDELLKNYRDLGYDELHAEKMVLWTKVYVLAGELRARYSKGWITEAYIREQLIDAGMDPDRVDIWIQKIIKPEKEERTAAERDLTKSEIIKGVKKGVLSPQDGIDLLMDMGYDQEEAEYIILINVEAASGSPETWSSFQEIVNTRRKAVGLPVKKIPENIKSLEKNITRLEVERTKMVKKKKKRPDIVKIEAQINPLKRQHSQLIAKYKKKGNK